MGLRSIEPVGHASALEGLWNAARARRLSHALCFAGPEGVGKFLAAERLAAGLLCANGPGTPCGACGPCKRLRAGSHPDVFVLDPIEAELESIPISWVTPRSDGPAQTIEQFLSLRAMEGGWRVVIVRESDRLVEEAQNALLKTLEEPGDDALLVLVTARPDRLLPTIHSRLVRVPFRLLTRDEARAALVQSGVPAARAAGLARLSGGAPGLGLALEKGGVDEMLTVLGAALEPGADPFALAASVAEIEGEYPGQTVPAQNRARARAFLDLAARVIHDGVRVLHGVPPDELCHGDLAVLAARLGEAGSSLALDRILAARQDVDANLAPDAAVERALCALETPRARSKKSTR